MSDQYPELTQPSEYPPPVPPQDYAQQFQAMPEVSMDMRSQRLAVAVATEVARGGRVESQNATSAMIVTGSKPNHGLHLALSILTCGAWLFAWPIIALVQKEHRVSVQIDPYGQALRQQLS